MRCFDVNMYVRVRVSVAMLRYNPYQIRFIRKAIDANAFRLYGHWIKKGDEQNRAALFENTLKQDAMAAHLRQMQTNGEVRFDTE